MPETRSRMLKLTGPRAFTLIELLAVIFIILLMAAMVLGIAQYAMLRARIARTEGQIQEMENQLLEYKLNSGIYPASLTAIVPKLPEGSGFDYVDDGGATHTIPLDAWNREYVYELRTPVSYTIYSHGPKTNITADDISGGG